MTDNGFTDRERCAHVISTLPMPDPFDTRTFLSALSEQRGKSIELVPATLPTTLPCGVLASTDEADYIFHATETTPLHAQHIDMHEVGHLVLDHTGQHGGRAAPKLSEQDSVRALLPDLSPALIRRILGRTVYNDSDEREAELFASLLLTRVHLAAAPQTDFTDYLSALGGAS